MPLAVDIIKQAKIARLLGVTFSGNLIYLFAKTPSKQRNPWE